MFKLPRNFRKTGSEPGYRKNSCGVERFAPGPDKVELRGGAFLMVPGPIALQRQWRTPCGSLHKPESRLCCKVPVKGGSRRETFLR